MDEYQSVSRYLEDIVDHIDAYNPDGILDKKHILGKKRTVRDILVNQRI